MWSMPLQTKSTSIMACLMPYSFIFLKPMGTITVSGALSLLTDSTNSVKAKKLLIEVFSFFVKLTTECVPQTGHVVKRGDDDILEAYFFHL